MLKHEEKSQENSCFNKADDDEPIFVLRAKDPCAETVILDWMSLRVGKGLNVYGDEKTTEAFHLVEKIREFRKKYPDRVKHEENQ